MTPTCRRLSVAAVAALTLAACGSDGASQPAPTTVDLPPVTEAVATTDAPPETEVTTTTEADTGTAIESYADVQQAVVQIVARGTIRDPEIGVASVAGSGSGFIISDDGLVVTNNHVVTGAATLEVFIGGDESNGYNATVVGVSECNDLALIQLDTDDALPSLMWDDADLSVGEDVYAAGFPLGDPEFTLTRGIVSKAKADGNTPWASIDSTLEHDANIQPGNSGGPLIAENGTVVGVNYATSSPTSTSQFFAIDSKLAQKVVEKLKGGDFESLGVNGRAVVDEATGIAGIWVSGVAPGSPASDTEILPGDIITSLNGLPVGDDGTYSDYCDVLRTAGDRPIDVEVLRFDTSEVLRGEVNGDKVLEQAFSFAEEVADETGVSTDPGTAYTQYQTLVDDSGQITIDVPTAWSDIDTSPFVYDDGSTSPYIAASTSLDGMNNSYDAPGLLFTKFEPIDDIDSALANFAPADGECTTDDGLSDYSDAVFTGRYHLWTGCGASGTTSILALAALPADGSYTALIAAQLVSVADLDALDRAFSSFNVVV